MNADALRMQQLSFSNLWLAESATKLLATDIFGFAEKKCPRLGSAIVLIETGEATMYASFIAFGLLDIAQLEAELDTRKLTSLRHSQTVPNKNCPFRKNVVNDSL